MHPNDADSATISASIFGLQMWTDALVIFTREPSAKNLRALAVTSLNTGDALEPAHIGTNVSKLRIADDMQNIKIALSTIAQALCSSGEVTVGRKGKIIKDNLSAAGFMRCSAADSLIALSEVFARAAVRYNFALPVTPAKLEHKINALFEP